jgi:hypothetical protein
MPWRDPKSVSFTRLDIVAHVPSESGVYAIVDGDCCVHVGESWNLKARLLELANILSEGRQFTIVYEACPEEQRSIRRKAVSAKLLGRDAEPDSKMNPLPGLSLRTQPPR